ncbi:MAG TPA: hypothetical protein PLM96_07200 [Methanoregulaceae archaeon]|nr:hypothetical protein [Methanoregulaceae archaeon]
MGNKAGIRERFTREARKFSQTATGCLPPWFGPIARRQARISLSPLYSGTALVPTRAF